MSRVFIIQEQQRFNVQSATQFGELVYMCEHVNQVDFDGTKRKLERALSELGFNPEKDYICLTGQTLALQMLVGILGSYHWTVRFLVFDARVSAYNCQTVAFNEQTQSAIASGS